MEPSTESIIAFLAILFSYLKNTGDEGKWHDDLFRLGFRKDCQQSITKTNRKKVAEIPEFARLESSCHSILR